MDHDQSRYMLVELAAQASMTARSVVRKLISCRRSYNSPVKLGLRHRILQSLAMAWNPPMRENSRSYWKAAETTNQRIKNDFLFSLRPVFVRSFLRCGDIIYLSPVERLDESSEERGDAESWLRYWGTPYFYYPMQWKTSVRQLACLTIDCRRTSDSGNRTNGKYQSGTTPFLRLVKLLACIQLPFAC